MIFSHLLSVQDTKAPPGFTIPGGAFLLSIRSLTSEKFDLFFQLDIPLTDQLVLLLQQSESLVLELISNLLPLLKIILAVTIMKRIHILPAIVTVLDPDVPVLVEANIVYAADDFTAYLTAFIFYHSVLPFQALPYRILCC